MATKCPQCQAENPESQSYCGNCGASLTSQPPPSATLTQTLDPPKEELTTGSLFADRYQIIEELGRGGMGRVYKALDTEINEKLAIKLLKPEIASNPKTIVRFRNELSLARRIRHKNVCQMYDISKEKGSYYITMEYVEGEDLKHLIRKVGGLSPAQAVNVAKQICEGLSAAHKIGVVHRDLKPQNIMLDEEGSIRIMDFGIARSLRTKGLTGAGTIIGTPEYMSPEQVEGKDVDARSDIYSLGVILFEMLTGRVPFEAESAFAIGYKHKNEPVPQPTSINPQVNQDLARIVLRCLEKDKDNRYPTAEELLADISSVEKTLPITPAAKVTPPKKSLTSKEITVTFGLKRILVPGAILIAAAIFILIWLTTRTKPPQAVLPERIENSIAVIGFDNLTGDESYDYLKKAIPNLIITNLENSGILHVATWERMEDIRKQIGGAVDTENIDRETGFEICRREGIGNIVTGSFTKAGDTFAIDVKVLDVLSKNLVKSASARGEGEDSILRNQIDELSREISTGIGISQAKLENVDLEVEDITTNSMEAYRSYLKGVEAYDKFYFGEAEQHLKKAVALDPQFAMAHLYLGRAEYNLGHQEARDKAYIRAKELSSKATEKEKLMIGAIYARFIDQDADKRVALLEEMKRKYPREKFPYYELGVVYDARNELDKALQNLQKLIELDPQDGLAYNQMAYVWMEKGDYDQALVNFGKYSALNPADANPIDSMGELYFRMGRFEESIAKYKQASQIKPGFQSEMNLAYVYAVMEQYDQALHWIDVYISHAPSTGRKSEAHLWKAIFLFRKGCIQESSRELDTAKELAGEAGNPWRLATLNFVESWQQADRGNWGASRKALQMVEDFLDKASIENKAAWIMVQYIYGLIDLGMSDIAAAKKKLERMQSLFAEMKSEYEKRGSPPEALNTNRFRLSWLQAKILLAEGRIDEAIPILQKANELKLSEIPNMHTDNLGPYNSPSQMDELAQAYAHQGDLEKAITEYERLLTRGPSNTNRRLVYPMYHFELAKLYEKKGWADRAVQEYETFVNIVKNADPGQTAREEAQARLSRLR